MWLNAIITLTVYGHRAFRTQVLGLARGGGWVAESASRGGRGNAGRVDAEGLWGTAQGRDGRRLWRSRWGTAKGRCSGSEGAGWGQPKDRWGGGRQLIKILS